MDPLFEEDWSFEGQPDNCVIVPQDTFLTNVADAMLKATELGMGVGLLPYYSASQAMQEGRLCRLLAPHRLRQREIYAIYPSRHYLDAKVRTCLLYTSPSPRD